MSEALKKLEAEFNSKALQPDDQVKLVADKKNADGADIYHEKLNGKTGVKVEALTISWLGKTWDLKLGGSIRVPLACAQHYLKLSENWASKAVVKIVDIDDVPVTLEGIRMDEEAQAILDAIKEEHERLEAENDAEAQRLEDRKRARKREIAKIDEEKAERKKAGRPRKEEAKEETPEE